MSELPAGIPLAEPPEPLDSASGIVVRRRPGGAWDALLATRSTRSRFLPGHRAFPGGRIDPEDEPGRPGAHARCVSREVAEETGLAIPPERWHPAGVRVTPPIFPLRFSTAFLVAEAPDDAVLPQEPPSPDEVDAIAFERPGDVVARWERGEIKVPPPVLILLRALSEAGRCGIDALAAGLARTNRGEEGGSRVEFVPDVWMVPVRTPTLPPATHTNVWIPGGDRLAVVDPGSEDPGEHARLVRVIGRRVARGARPAAVLLTHHHEDHVGGAARLARELAVPLRAHGEVLDRLGPDAGQVDVEPLVDGEIIDLGGLTLRAHLTPGHAPGHLAFEVPERGALIAGDLVSGLSTILIEPSTGDMGVYLDSLRRAAALDCRTVLPAHGPALPARALGKTLDHRRERESRVVAALADGPRRLDEIAADAYRELPGTPAILTEMQTLAHLRHLETLGAARRDGDGRWGRV